MASTYTTNLGIEKIGTGDQSGTWGETTNTNFDIIDQAINGVLTLVVASAGTSGSPNTLPITDGSESNGRNKFIEFTDGGDLGADVFYQLTPSDAEKIVFVRNSLTNQDLVLFQGTYNASNDIVVPNGKDMLVKFDGAGASATVTDVFNDLNVTAFTSSSVDINGGTVDNADITVGAGRTLDVSSGTLTLANDQISGDKVSGGTIGTVTITALAGNLSLGDNNITNVGDIAVDSISADATDMDITLTDNSATALEIKEGSNAYLTFDSTNAAEKITLGKKLEAGSVEIEGSNFDINGGAIDGAIIGANTAAAGTFTAITGTSLNLTEGNITNAGDVALDSISADDSDIDILLTDNRSAGLEIKEGSNAYLTFVTLNGSEKVTLGQKLEAGAVEIEGSNFDIQGGTIGSSVTATTQAAGTNNTTVATTSFAATAADNAAVALAIALG